MAIRQTLRNLFAPSPEVAAARRKDVFGTESKAVATGAVVGGAALAIAAPALIAGGALRSAGAAVARAPVAAKVGGFFAAPLVAGAIINEPKTITRTVGGIANVQGNLFELGRNPTVENARNLIMENPVIVGSLAAGAAALGGVGIGSVANTIATQRNTAALEKLAPTTVQSLPFAAPVVPEEQGPSTPPAAQPLTRETMVLGREAGGVAKRKPRKKTGNNGQRVSVRVVNQNNFIGARTETRQWSTSRVV